MPAPEFLNEFYDPPPATQDDFNSLVVKEIDGLKDAMLIHAAAIKSLRWIHVILAWSCFFFAVEAVVLVVLLLIAKGYF